MNLSRRQLELFVMTAALGNISRASERLHISQPALTRAIQQFESQLNVKLFDRTTRKLSLTKAAEKLLPMAQQLLSEMDRTVADVRDHAAGLGGVVQLCAGVAFCCTVLPGVLREFTRSHPKIRIRIKTDSSAAITQSVINGDCDIGIGSPVGNTTALQCQQLLAAPLGLLGDPKRFSFGPAMTEKQLRLLPLLKESDDTSIVHLLRLHGSSLLGRMNTGLEISCLASQIAFANAGVGVAVVSALGASHPQAKGLRFVPLKPAVEREIFIMQRQHSVNNPSVSALRAALFAGISEAALHPSVRYAVEEG